MIRGYVHNSINTPDDGSPQPRARPFCRSKGSRSLLLQTTNPLITWPLSGSHNWALYWVAAKAFPILILLMSRTWQTAVGTTFNVFSYYAVWAEPRIHHLPNAELVHYVLCNGHGLDMCLDKILFVEWLNDRYGLIGMDWRVVVFLGQNWIIE